MACDRLHNFQRSHYWSCDTVEFDLEHEYRVTSDWGKCEIASQTMSWQTVREVLSSKLV
jgi:hypothetical protein